MRLLKHNFLDKCQGCKLLLRRPQLPFRQGFLPPDPKCSSGSIGRPDPRPP
ncbi:MAG: hypothetical protein JWO91_1945 [Acidobacteriaceae bacterium]|nr:hypothetical protein [Acidobacteriaceae bacterium]